VRTLPICGARRGRYSTSAQVPRYQCTNVPMSQYTKYQWPNVPGCDPKTLTPSERHRTPAFTSSARTLLNPRAFLGLELHHHAPCEWPRRTSPHRRSDFAWHAVGRLKCHHHALHREVQVWLCSPGADTAAAAAVKLGARTRTSLRNAAAHLPVTS
jgi:hypothetical protein